MRGSLPVSTVPNSEPKLVPDTPMRAVSSSGRAAIQSTRAGPAAIQFSMVKWSPIIGASYWPGPSIASTAMPRLRNLSP